MKCLVSACLVGLCTRYDGQNKPSSACRKELERQCWIPLCPEQLGGLSTPRIAADLVGGDGEDVLAGRAKVLTRDGGNVTANFVKGAYQCLEVARMQSVTMAYMKAGSPSCGVFSRLGVTAALLLQHGLELKEF